VGAYLASGDCGYEEILEDFGGAVAGTVKGGEVVGCAIKGASGAVGEAGYGVAEKSAVVIHEPTLYICSGSRQSDLFRLR
jgi:hypothetical protein